MKKLTISLMIAFLFIVSCSEKKPESVLEKDSTVLMTVKKDTSLIINKELKTRSGKEFKVIESKPSYSISNYFISGEGFLNSSDTIKYMNKNPMVNTLLADLDENGYEELYILTKSTGSASFMDILGIASVNDKSFEEIIVQDISAEDVKKDEMFNGYMGYDSVYISGNSINRIFPVFKSSDTRERPTGGKRKIIYELSPTETNYQLEITGSKNIQ